MVELKSEHLGSSFLLGGTSAGTQHADELLGVDLVVVVDGQVGVGLVDLRGGELVPPGHQGVAEHVAVDVAVVLDIRLERLLDELVIVHLALVLLGEHVEEHGEVEGAIGLGQHVGDFAVADDAADLVEDGAEIFFAEDTVLISVHDLEAFLHFGHLFLGEHVKDIAARLLCLLRRRLGSLGRHGRKLDTSTTTRTTHCTE